MFRREAVRLEFDDMTVSSPALFRGEMGDMTSISENKGSAIKVSVGG